MQYSGGTNRPGASVAQALDAASCAACQQSPSWSIGYTCTWQQDEWRHWVGSDLLKAATAAWWAGSEELNRVRTLPGASSAIGSIGVLPIGDARVDRGALNAATTKLATMLGTLQAATTTARDWGAEIGLADLNLPTQVQAVEAQTRHVITLREKYEARSRR